MTEGAVSLGALTLLPVSESICLGERMGRTVLFRAAKRPIAIVVISPAETRVFRITGKEISLAALMTEVPEVGKTIMERTGTGIDEVLKGAV